MSDPGRRSTRILAAMAACGVFAAFLLALLAFGGRSLAWVVLACSLMAAGAAVGLAWSGQDVRRLPRTSLGAAALLVALPLASLIPLPASLAGALSERRVELARATWALDDFTGWLEAVDEPVLELGAMLEDSVELPSPPEAVPAGAASPARDESLPLSFDAPFTLVAWATLACFLALLLALAGGSHRLGLRLLAACGAATALMSVYAITWARFGNDKVYGIFPVPPNIGQQPFGSFWNANHLAALLAALGILALAALLTRQLSLPMRLASALAALPLWAGLVDAKSRGGVLGATAGILVLGAILLASGRKRRGLGATLVLVAVGGLGVATLVAPEKLLGQSLEKATSMTGSNFDRSRIYRAEVAMVRDAPLVGVGLGAFRAAYPAFQTEPDPFVPLHGESDWLESLAEGGFPLGIAWLALIGSLLWPALRAARRDEAPVLLAGLIAGTCALLAHAAVDFHLREPSVALAALLMAGSAAAWGLRLGDEARERSEEPRVASSGRVFVTALALGGAIVLAVLAQRIIAWDRGMRGAAAALAEGQAEAAVESARAATLAWPAPASSWALLAASEEQAARAAPPRERAAGRERALAAAVEALRRSPVALGAARNAAQVLLARGSESEALQAAELAVRVAPGHASAHRILGQVHLRAGRLEEALPSLAFALTAMPGEQAAQQGRPLVRMLREASGGDAARVFSLVHGRESRTLYIHVLASDGHGDETGPAFTQLLAEGVPPDEADAWAYALVGGSPEAAEMGRRLLPHVSQPLSRVRIARALLAVESSREEGMALLTSVLGAPDAPAAAYSTLVLEQRAEGDLEASRATLAAGLAAHPTDPTLQLLSR